MFSYLLADSKIYAIHLMDLPRTMANLSLRGTLSSKTVFHFPHFSAYLLHKFLFACFQVDLSKKGMSIEKIFDFDALFMLLDKANFDKVFELWAIVLG